MDCVPGKVYRKECNTCRCGPNNALMCTKMACLSNKDQERVKEKLIKQKKIEKQEKEMKEKRQKLKKTQKTRWFPELPEGECVPGKLYQKDCRGCFCNSNKTAMCVKQKNTCDKSYYPESADAIRPTYSKSEFEALPPLPHIAAKCEPGKSYRVQCNSCVCLINYSLMCDLAMCLSYNDMHNSAAIRASNQNCTRGEEVKPPNECIQCSCTKNGKTKCEEIPGCVTTDEKRRSLHGQVPKIRPLLKLEYDENEKCFGGSIYRLHCNRCFCQEDGSMRCTQKTCLNYAQSLKLKKHRLYLEKHGL